MEHVNSFNKFATVSGPSFKGINYFSTTSLGGVSKNEYRSFNLGLNTADNTNNVKSNHLILRNALPSDPVLLQQVHGNEVLDLTKHTISSYVHDNATLPQADAAVTATKGQVLAILTADCLPVVITNTSATIVGVAHAGWRGLSSGVLQNTLQVMKNSSSNTNSLWQAWIGPCIHTESFEVGNDVLEAFIDINPSYKGFFVPGVNRGKWYADLIGLAKEILVSAGVLQVYHSPWCTYKNSHLFYS